MYNLAATTGLNPSGGTAYPSRCRPLHQTWASYSLGAGCGLGSLLLQSSPHYTLAISCNHKSIQKMLLCEYVKGMAKNVQMISAGYICDSLMKVSLW